MYDLCWPEAQSVAEAIPNHYSKKALKDYIARMQALAVFERLEVFNINVWFVTPGRHNQISSVGVKSWSPGIDVVSAAFMGRT
jgi:hypothetical protein